MVSPVPLLLPLIVAVLVVVPDVVTASRVDNRECKHRYQHQRKKDKHMELGVQGSCTFLPGSS